MGKILAVDDNKNNLILISEILKLHMPKIQVFTCLSSYEVFNETIAIQPDLILLDIQMPLMNGFEVCELLKSKEATKDIPILFITAFYTDHESKIRGLNLGADGFIAKPIKPEELIAKIKVMLRIKRAEDELKLKNKQLKELLDKKERKLEESERKYKSMFNNNHAMIVLVNPATLEIADANPAACKFYGYPFEQFIKKKVTDISLIERKEIFNEIERIRASTNEQVFYKHKSSEGAIKDVEIFSGLIEIDKEEFILSIIHDVTERKKIEHELQEQLQFNKTLLNAIPNPIYYQDIKGKLIGYNKAYKENFGAKNLQVIDSQPHQTTAKKDIPNYPKEKVYSEIKIKNKSNEHREVAIHKSAIVDHSGNPKGSVAVIVDITSSKNQEIKLKEANAFSNKLIEVSPYGVIVYKKNGECILTNISAQKIIGARTKEHVLKQNFHQIDSWKKSGLHAMSQEVLRNKKLQKKDVQLITTFGKYIWIEVNMVASSINNEDHLIVLINDLTNQKENEKHIKKSLEYQKLISLVGIKLNEVNKIDVMLNEVLEQTSEFVGASNAIVFKCNSTKNDLKVIGQWNKDNFPTAENNPYKTLKSNTLKSIFKNVDYLAIEDTSIMPKELLDIINSNTIKSLVMFPLKSSEDLLGFIAFEQRNFFHKWSYIHIEIIKAIALIIANALAREKMLDSLMLSEEKFRQLSTNIDDVVLLIEKNTIIYHNQSFNKITGISDSYENKSVRKLFNILQTDSKKKITNKLKEASDNGIQFNEEIKIKKTDGSEPWIWFRSFHIKNDSGVIYRHVLIASDITKKKEIENQIMQTIINTEEVERKRFAEDLHDGIGPLLSSVKLYVNLLKLKTKKSQQTDYLEILENIEDLIQDAVRTTRSIANDLTPNILNDYGLENAIERFVNKINKSETIKIILNSTIGAKRFSKEVEINLYRILKELINNSIKHSECKQIDINIALVKRELSFIYKDNGIGCNIEMILKDKKNGLGISNLQNRANSINGALTFKSSQGKGFNATFIVKLDEY